MKRLIAVAVAALSLGGLIRLRWLTGRGWGTAGINQHQDLAGDDVIPWADEELTHAITINVPRQQVWPWIVQMGVKRGGWYTPRWVDRYLWRVNNVSIDHVDPSLQTLKPDDVILDGPVGTAEFRVVEVRPDEALVLHSRRHPLTGVPPNMHADNPGPYLDFSWTFVLQDVGTEQCLLLIRTRGVARMFWLGRRMAWVVWPMLDYLMARWMLLGIKDRAESVAAVKRPTAESN